MVSAAAERKGTRRSRLAIGPNLHGPDAPASQPASQPDRFNSPPPQPPSPACPAPSADGVIIRRPCPDAREATAQRGAAKLRLPFPPCRASGVYGAPAAAPAATATAAATAGCCLYGEEEEEERELSDTSRSRVYLRLGLGGEGRVGEVGRGRERRT